MFVKKILLAIVFFLFTVIIATVGAYFYVLGKIEKPADETGFYRNFIITSGQSAMQVGENLVKEGIVDDSFYFKFYLWKFGLKSSIKAGEYNLSSAMNIPAIVDIISKGKIIERDVVVLIPEGLTSVEVEEILVDKELIKKDQLIEAVDGENLKRYYRYDFLFDKPKDANLEGYLFPDTYKFYKKTTPEDILEKIFNNFDKKIDSEMRSEIARQGKTIFEILTLASIVQEEANGEADIKIIAGIFANRLAIGKPLESDATINFISGKKMRQPFYSDLESDSPYNTYKYAGLPPGPINNPGIKAIQAVIWPKETDYLYFLHASDGKAYYGKTYEEHLRNKAKYLK